MTQHPKKYLPIPFPQKERGNIISHAIGIVLALLASGFLIYKGYLSQNNLALFSYVVYGLAMCLLYVASTLYHCFRISPLGSYFRILDHASIFLLIAGTYTPVSLTIIGGKLGLAMAIIVWLIALAGIFLKFFYLEASSKISNILYLSLGWFVVIFFKPLISHLSPSSFFLLLAGGVTYSAGVFFYRMKRKAYAHTIWHGFVLAGSALMFFAIYFQS